MSRALFLPLLLARLAQGTWPALPDCELNVTQILFQREGSGVYLGSPSILRLPGSRAVLASHDYFGALSPAFPHNVAAVLSAPAAGGAFGSAGTGEGLYWASLFERSAAAPGDAGVYLMGVSDDGDRAAITVARSGDGGATWQPSPAAVLARNATSAFSTGPTPVLLWAGRLWRAFEHNSGPGWASGYACVVMSAPADAADLTSPAAWTMSGELPFAAVRSLVPAAWSNASGGFNVAGSFGWLEGNAVQPEDASDAGIYVMLRVQAGPTANKAALLYLASPTDTPVFRQWVQFPGGQTKFTVRRDAQTGLYVTLSNALDDARRDSVTLPPACGPVALPPGNPPLPCCGFLRDCATAPVPTCVWCHSAARNNLTLVVATRAAGPWTVVASVLADDTGQPAYMSELQTGFQYADFQFDGDDLLAAVRAGYRGANNYHNSNRHLLKIVSNWRALVPKQILDSSSN